MKLRNKHFHNINKKYTSIVANETTRHNRRFIPKGLHLHNIIIEDISLWVSISVLVPLLNQFIFHLLWKHFKLSVIHIHVNLFSFTFSSVFLYLLFFPHIFFCFCYSLFIVQLNYLIFFRFLPFISLNEILSK